MTARGPQAAALVLHRFGLGPLRNSIAAIASDPRGALLEELNRPGAGRMTSALPSSGQASRAVFRFQAERRAQQKLVQRAKKVAEAGGASNPFDCKQAPTPEPCVPSAIAVEPEKQDKPRQPPLPQQIILNEAKARFDAATGAEIGFVERLVWFWSNHFCISADKISRHGGRLRARSHPAPRARPFRRHVAGGRKPSGDAVLSRQCSIDGARFNSGHRS